MINVTQEVHEKQKFLPETVKTAEKDSLPSLFLTMHLYSPESLALSDLNLMVETSSDVLILVTSSSVIGIWFLNHSNFKGGVPLITSQVADPESPLFSPFSKSKGFIFGGAAFKESCQHIIHIWSKQYSHPVKTPKRTRRTSTKSKTDDMMEAKGSKDSLNQPFFLSQHGFLPLIC